MFQTNLPVFKIKESSVRRRYSDFEWLRNELERDSKIVVPPLPGKAWKRQLPFRNDDGIFEEEFIEERRRGLEVFINKYVNLSYFLVKLQEYKKLIGIVDTLNWAPRFFIVHERSTKIQAKLLSQEEIDTVYREKKTDFAKQYEIFMMLLKT